MHARNDLLLILLSVCTSATAQTVLDGAYIPEHTVTRRALPYPHVREADVAFAQRVWRIIDVRERMNLPLFYPMEPVQGRKSLFEVIRDGILENGTLTAYDVGVVAQDDDFTKPLLIDEVRALLDRVDTVWTPRLEDPDIMDPVAMPISVSSAEITRYQLKEDHVFNSALGRMEIRIIGLAPMREVRGDDGELRGHAPLFWLYFPELRYVLANEGSFNRWNDGDARSFDHLFQDRMFASTIVKVSNVHDRRVGDHAQGIDGLLEGQRREDRLFQTAYDLWNY